MAVLHRDEGWLIRADAFRHKRKSDVHELLIGAIDQGLVDESIPRAGRFPIELHLILPLPAAHALTRLI
jgi:hypothetical protein